jgi:hypothetical protein
MTSRQRDSVALLCVIALVQGCASYEGVPNEAWFPREAVAVENRIKGQVALRVPPMLQAAVVDVGRSVRLQIGPIAQQAMLVALSDGVQGGVRQINAVPASATSGSNPTLVLDDVRFEHEERTLWFVWIPPLSSMNRYETSTRLMFDVSLLDAQGGFVWRRTYEDDAGRLAWSTPSGDSAPLPKDIGRLAHEAAWRLARRVMRDLREWMDTQRLQPREL